MKPILRTRFALGLATVLAATAAAVTVNPTPAAAADPVCYTWQFKQHTFLDARAQVPSYNHSFACILRPGDRGFAVEMLQLSLIYCHNADLSPAWIDGIYGPKTRDAVAWIQGANGLSVDGVYGPKTRGAMKWVWRNGARSWCLPWPT